MLEIVPMKNEHINDVVFVEKMCFHTPWLKEDFEREINKNKMAMYFVAIYNNKVVGYAGMWHIVNEGHITNVAVLEEYRRKGIGNLLIEKLIETAENYEMIGITLEVRIGNIPAQKLYTKYGFKPEGIRKNYYSDTHEDAIIMWKYFPSYENYNVSLNIKGGA